MFSFQDPIPHYRDFSEFGFERYEVIPTGELDCNVEGITVGFESVERLLNYQSILISAESLNQYTVESVRLGVVAELKGLSLYYGDSNTELAFESASFATSLGMENAFVDGLKKVWDAICSTIKAVVEKVLEFLGFSSAKVVATEKKLDKEKEKLEETVKKAKKSGKDNKSGTTLQIKLVQEDFAYLGREVKAGDILKESEKLVKNEPVIVKIFDQTKDVQSKVTDYGSRTLDAIKEDLSEGSGGMFMAIGGMFKQGIGDHIKALPAPQDVERYVKALNNPAVVRPYVRALDGYVRGSELVFYSVPAGDGAHRQNFQEVRFVHFGGLNQKTTVNAASCSDMEHMLATCERVNTLYGNAITNAEGKVKSIKADIKKLTDTIQEALEPARAKKDDPNTYYKSVQADLVAIKLAMKSVKLFVVNLSGSLSAALVTNGAHLNYMVESRNLLDKELAK